MISIYRAKQKTAPPRTRIAPIVPAKQPAQDSSFVRRQRAEKWGSPIKPSVDLQIEIEELTHTTGFTFAELERMEADED